MTKEGGISIGTGHERPFGRGSGMRRGWHLGGSLVVPEKVAAAHLIEDAEARQMLLPQRSRGPGGRKGKLGAPLGIEWLRLWIRISWGNTPAPSQMSSHALRPSGTGAESGSGHVD